MHMKLLNSIWQPLSAYFLSVVHWLIVHETHQVHAHKLMHLLILLACPARTITLYVCRQLGLVDSSTGLV